MENLSLWKKMAAISNGASTFWKSKWRSILILNLGVLMFTVPYLFTNYVNSLRTEHFHFYFQWEIDYIPFISWMIVPYCMAYLIPFITLSQLSLNEQKALSWAIGISGFVGGILFLLFPTVLGFERDPSKTGIWMPIYQWLWATDKPHNLCPSMHVVMAYLLLVPIIFKVKTQGFKILLTLLLGLISISILFVHQHHIMDLVAGLEMGFLAEIFIYRPMVKHYAAKDAIVVMENKHLTEMQDKNKAA